MYKEGLGLLAAALLLTAIHVSETAYRDGLSYRLDDLPDFGSAQLTGLRGHRCEDRFLAEVIEAGECKWDLFAVFDGHGGSEVSEFIQRRFRDEIVRLLRDGNKWTREVLLNEAFKHVQREVAKQGSRFGEIGSTATVVLIGPFCDNPSGRYSTITIGNLGDSRALVVDTQTGAIVVETKDHKPNDPNEESRIKKLGGTVTRRGSARVQGVLAVSRSYGDFALEPYVTSHATFYGPIPFTRDLAVVVASDGLFDDVSSAEAARVLMSHPEASPTSLAYALAYYALGKGSRDDISVVVARGKGAGKQLGTQVQWGSVHSIDTVPVE